MIKPNIKVITDIKTDDNIIKINNIEEVIKKYFKNDEIFDVSTLKQYNIIKNISDFFSIDIYDLLYLKDPKDKDLEKYINNYLSNDNVYRGEFTIYYHLFSLKDLDIINRNKYLYYILKNIIFKLNLNKSVNFYCFDEISYIFCEFLVKYNKINDYYDFTPRNNETYLYNNKENILYKYIEQNEILKINVDEYNIKNLYLIKNKIISIIGSNYVLGNIFYSILEKENSVILNIEKPNDEKILNDYSDINYDNFNNVNYKYLFEYFELGKKEIKIIDVDTNLSESDILKKNDKYNNFIQFANVEKTNILAYKLITDGVKSLINDDENKTKKIINAISLIFSVWSESIESFNILLAYIDLLNNFNFKYNNDNDISNTLKVFKIFTYKIIISQYDKFIDKKDYLFLYKNYIKHFEEINIDYHTIGKKEIKKLDKYFGINFLYVYKMKVMGVGTPYCVKIFNFIRNKSSKTPEINFNLIDYIYSLNYIVYKLSRELTERNYGWYKNNIIIEKSLEYIKYYIDLLLQNKNKLSSIIYRRVISLTSTYYNIKIRYNIDNNKYDTESLIDEYLDAISQIAKEKKHYINIITTSKLLEEFYKVQNFYNYFNINKNISNNKIFISFMYEYSSIFMSTFIANKFYNVDYFYEDVYLSNNDEKDKEFKIFNYQQTIYELIRPFTGIKLLDGNKYFEYDNIEFLESKIKYIENDWNTHKKSDKLFKKIICKNNYIELGFIYE